jgi:hypothetical protein
LEQIWGFFLEDENADIERMAFFFFWKFGAFSFYSASTPTETHGFFLENENADILN